jgi:phospholipase/carboxylesterase
VRFVLPNAPVRPVSINGGYEMRAWYDIIPTPSGRVEDEPSLRAAHLQINALIDREVARGIAPERIVVMGFSQGCAMALMAGLRYPKRLAGVAALSGYLPLLPTTASERSPTNAHTPIFMAPGQHDDVVLPQRGEAARDHLESLGYSVQWHSYPMAHSLCLPEIQDLNDWLLRTLA